MRYKRKSRPFGALFLVGASVALAVAMASSAFPGSQARRGDDFCLPGEPAGLLVVAVDATDALSDAQRRDVGNRVRSIVSEMPVDWRVEIWNVAPTVGEPASVDSFCKPEVNVSPWTANPKKAKLRGEAFWRRFEEQFSTVLTHASSKSSPILEAVQAVGLRTFKSAAARSAHNRRLVLVSDLIQNTARLSFAESLPSYQGFRKTGLFEVSRAPLPGLEVDILLLSRPGARRLADVVLWWQQWFADCGATVTTVQRIVG